MSFIKFCVAKIVNNWRFRKFFPEDNGFEAKYFTLWVHISLRFGRSLCHKVIADSEKITTQKV